MTIFEDEIKQLNLPELIERDYEGNFETYFPIRRAEIARLLQKEYLGDWPGELALENRTAEVENMGFCSRKAIELTVKGPETEASFRLDLYEPQNYSGRLASFVFLNFEDRVDSGILEKIMASGMALASVNYQNIEPDVASDEELNVQRLIKNFPGRSWGKIGAWAYGASCIIDFLSRLSEIDEDHIAVIGHSRLGLAAAWCGAMDQRLALTICNNNGALYRGSKAESYTDLSRDYTRHWFSQNAFKGGRDENQIPFDMHFLHALIAPRYLYLAGAKADKWCDAHSQLLSAIAASPAYDEANIVKESIGFSGKKVEKPGLTSYPCGRIGYHVRDGEHDLKPEDWDEFLSYRKLHNV